MIGWKNPVNEDNWFDWNCLRKTGCCKEIVNLIVNVAVMDQWKNEFKRILETGPYNIYRREETYRIYAS